MREAQIIYVQMWVKIICPLSIHPNIDDFNQFHEYFEERPILPHLRGISLWLSRSSSEPTVKDVNCSKQNPHLTQKHSVSNLFFPMSGIYLPFIWNSRSHLSHTGLLLLRKCMRGICGWRKESFCYLSFFGMLIGKDSLKSIESIGLCLRAFNNLSKCFLTVFQSKLCVKTWQIQKSAQTYMCRANAPTQSASDQKIETYHYPRILPSVHLSLLIL